jgi:hypothetical protein
MIETRETYLHRILPDLHENRVAYLIRVLPDLDLIRGDIEDGANSDKQKSDFALNVAISRVTKLLDDLDRAYHAPQ